MNKLINFTSVVLYCSFIYWVSSQPSVPVDKLFQHQDKLHHMAAYFILGALSRRFFLDYFIQPRPVIISSLFFCSLYGASDEWHQSFVPGRDADIYDWLADTLGASIALTYLYFRNKINN